MSRSCRPVTSGAPSEMRRSTRWGVEGCSAGFGEGREGERAARMRGIVVGCVMSACRVVMPGRGAMGWRSTATILMSLRGSDGGG